MKNEILRVCDLRNESRQLGMVTPILRGVSFSLGTREILAIVGESGCGKSMTLQSILQLPPTNIYTTGGSIQLQGRELTACTAKELSAIRGREIGMIFQDPVRSLDPTMTIERQMLTTIQAHQSVSKSQARAMAQEALAEVGFETPEQILRRYPHTLSGGQCQRVMIAIALLLSPRVLLADEPTTSLDVIAQHEILGLLRSLKEKRDISILFVSHDLRVVSSLADRIAVMYRGKIVEIGDTEQILHQPQHPYTKSLLSSAPSVAYAPKSLINTHQLRRAIPPEYTGCPYTGICPEAMNICLKKAPVYAEDEAGHGSACWLRRSKRLQRERDYV